MSIRIEADELVVLPASFTQQARFLRSRGGLVHDNLPMAWKLEGDLDRDGLTRAIADVGERHESLRTSIRMLDGVPVQVIHPSVVLRPAFTDITTLPSRARERALAIIAASDADRPFDLSRPFPLRIHLVHTAPTSHVLIVTATHAFWDGWSTSVFLRDLECCFVAQQTNSSSGLRPLDIQFGDFAAAQWNMCDVEAEARRAEDPVGPWPWRCLPERCDSARAELRQERFKLTGSAELAALGRAARRTGTTLSTALLSAFGCAIAGLGCATEPVIAVVDANREFAETHDIIGSVASYDLVQLRVTGARSRFERLAQTHDDVGSAQRRRMPLERLLPSPVSLFGDGDAMASDGPFDVVFNDLSHSANEARARSFGDVRLSPLTLARSPQLPSTAWWHRAKLAFNVTAADRVGVDVLVEYRADRVSEALVRGLAATTQRELAGTARA